MRVKLLFLIIACLPLTTQAAVTLPGPLIESAWLANNKDKVVILDVRKDVKSFTAKPIYKKDKKTKQSKLVRVGGHIPGARLINYSKVRAKHKLNGKQVTRNVPTKKDFEKLMQAAGLNKGDTVVIVSKGEHHADMTMATRLYWTLKYFGHNNLAVLNGGTAQWILDKQSVSSKPAKVAKGNWTAAAQDRSIFASSEDVAKSVKTGKTQLVDTREVSLYLGTYNKSYVYDKGHIDGAKNYPNELLTSPKLPARFTTKEETQKLMTALGIDPAADSITYCNSGHLASGSWFLMHEVMGNKKVKLYDGSMHEWTLEKRPTTSVLAK